MEKVASQLEVAGHFTIYTLALLYSFLFSSFLVFFVNFFSWVEGLLHGRYITRWTRTKSNLDTMSATCNLKYYTASSTWYSCGHFNISCLPESFHIVIKVWPDISYLSRFEISLLPSYPWAYQVMLGSFLPSESNVAPKKLMPESARNAEEDDLGGHGHAAKF